MLHRTVTVLQADGHEQPSLRNLVYGGSKVGLPLVRGSRTPDRVVFRDGLPTTATGKVLRRQVVAPAES